MNLLAVACNTGPPHARSFLVVRLLAFRIRHGHLPGPSLERATTPSHPRSLFLNSSRTRSAGMSAQQPSLAPKFPPLVHQILRQQKISTPLRSQPVPLEADYRSAEAPTGRSRS